MTDKYCVNCVNCYEMKDFKQENGCPPVVFINYLCTARQERSLVTGEPHIGTAPTCLEMREGSCGEEGRYYMASSKT